MIVARPAQSIMIVAVSVSGPVIVAVHVHGERYRERDLYRRGSENLRRSRSDHAHGGVPVQVHGHDHGRASPIARRSRAMSGRYCYSPPSFDRPFSL